MNLAYKLVKILDKILNLFIYLCLIIVFLYCLYALFDTIKVYMKASKNSVSILKPDKDNIEESFKSLKAINDDICGWITIENTNIDYPIVRGKNNSEYINKDVYGNYSLSGSLFLDYRNSMNFTDLYSIVFGHNMNGGAMFSDIKKFANKSYFIKREYGELYTEQGYFKLQIVAYLSTDAYDNYIYNINVDNENQQRKVIEYIKSNAVCFSETELSETDNLICLSTCSTANTNGRDILIVKIL